MAAAMCLGITFTIKQMPVNEHYGIKRHRDL